MRQYTHDNFTIFLYLSVCHRHLEETKTISKNRFTLLSPVTTFFYCAVCNNICTYAPDGRKRTITTGVVAPAATLLLQGQVTSAFIDLLTPSLWIVAISKTKLSMFFCLSGGRRAPSRSHSGRPT